MNKKTLSAILLIICLLLVTVGCSSNNSYSNTASSMAALGAPQTHAREMMDTGVMNEIAVDMEFTAEEPSANSGLLSSVVPAQQRPANRKIVTTFDITAETTEFDNSIQYIPAVVAAYGGYIESSSIQGRSINDGKYYNTRSAYFTLRIPSVDIHKFVAELDEQYNIVNTEEYSDDITDSYYDSAARLKSLEDQEKQLTTLLEKGDELQYLLEVQREIANVRYQIESLHSQLQRMDKSVDFSTVRISLQEVMIYQPVDPVPVSFGERVRMAFSDSLRNFSISVQNSLVWFIIDLPFHIANLLVLAVIFIIARIVIRKCRGLKKGQPTFASKHKQVVEASSIANKQEVKSENPQTSPTSK